MISNKGECESRMVNTPVDLISDVKYTKGRPNYNVPSILLNILNYLHVFFLVKFSNIHFDRRPGIDILHLKLSARRLFEKNIYNSRISI